MANSIKSMLSKPSATNVSLNRKSLRYLSSLRDVMRLLHIEEKKTKK